MINWDVRNLSAWSLPLGVTICLSQIIPNFGTSPFGKGLVTGRVTLRRSQKSIFGEQTGKMQPLRDTIVLENS